MSDLISREDAIGAVRKELVCDGRHEAHDKTCRFIADVLLSALPSAEGGDAEVNETKSPYMQQSPNNGADLISRQDAIDTVEELNRKVNDGREFDTICTSDVLRRINALPSADAVYGVGRYEKAMQKTDGDMGEVSDGYHTFNQLYHQRAVLFATIVKQNKEKAWKSWKHGDGKFCFDSNKEWFIVGVDTPEGSYTYHYEKKYWDMFDCAELEYGKFWDGHTEKDVTRLLSLPSANRPTGEWVPCSERLPEEEKKTYWVCTDTECQCECRWTNNRFGIGEGEWGWSIFDTPQYSKPIAWMPLPEPYREDGET